MCSVLSSTAERSEPIDLGTDAGLRRVWEMHAQGLKGFAARRLDDVGRGEDAVQETFLRAWRSADRFDARCRDARPWLFAILRNVIIDMVRAQARRPQTTALDTDELIEDVSDNVVLGLTM